MDLSWLDVLHRRLSTDRDLAAILHEFHDHLDAAPGFFDLGQPVRDPMLELLVEKAATSALGLKRRARLQSAMMLRVAEKHFVHGALSIAGRAGQLLWFEETGRGLMALTRGLRSKTILTRITALIVPAEDRSRN